LKTDFKTSKKVQILKVSVEQRHITESLLSSSVQQKYSKRKEKAKNENKTGTTNKKILVKHSLNP
jgi:hypothetical protein